MLPWNTTDPSITILTTFEGFNFKAEVSNENIRNKIWHVFDLITFTLDLPNVYYHLTQNDQLSNFGIIYKNIYHHMTFGTLFTDMD